MNNNNFFIWFISVVIFATLCSRGKTDATGENSGPELISDSQGKTLFERRQEIVERSLNITNGGELTVSLWLKIPGKLEERHYHIISYPRFNFYIWEGRSLVFEILPDNFVRKENITCGTGIPADTEWHHVAAVWYKNYMCLYVDGNLMAAEALKVKLPPEDPHKKIKVGNESLIVRDVAVYNKALTAEDIAEITDKNNRKEK